MCYSLTSIQQHAWWTGHKSKNATMAYTPDYGSQHGVDMHPVNGGGHRFGV